MTKITVNGCTINVSTSQGVWGWFAVDDDRYAGVLDAGKWSHLIGHGKTEAEAIDDLRDQIEDLDYEASYTGGKHVHRD